ncbi:MAG: hypothetical protein ABJB74_06310 [Gemmatimonas sp.]
MQYFRSARAVLVGMMAIVALGDCNEWKSPDENVLTLSANQFPADSAQTFATLDMPGVAQILNETQLNARAQFTVKAKSGTIRLKFARVKGIADTISRGEISFDIVKGYTYYADFSREHPTAPHICIGCGGWLLFPMIGSEHGSTDVMRLNYTNGLPLCQGCVAVRSEGVKMYARRE